MRRTGLFQPNPTEVKHQKRVQKARAQLAKKTGYLHEAQEAYKEAARLMGPFQDKIAVSTEELKRVNEQLLVKEQDKLRLEKKRLEKTIKKISDQLAPYLKRLTKLGQDIKALEEEINTWIKENP